MDSRIFRARLQGSKLLALKSYLYQWKALDEGYNFASDLIAIEGLYKKLCALKIARVLVVIISGLSLGSPRTKNHLDVGPMERRRVYYKGEGGGFPQVWAVVNLVCPSCPWLVLAPFCVGFVQVHVSE